MGKIEAKGYAGSIERVLADVTYQDFLNAAKKESALILSGEALRKNRNKERMKGVRNNEI